MSFKPRHDALAYLTSLYPILVHHDDHYHDALLVYAD